MKPFRNVAPIVCGLAMMLLSGCGGTAKLPTRAQVWLENPDGTWVPAANVLVLAERVSVCSGGWGFTPGSDGIDAYLVRTDSKGAIELPPRTVTYYYPCATTALDMTAWKPGYDTRNPGVRRGPPEMTAYDALLVSRNIDEERAGELVTRMSRTFSSYTVSQDMRRRVYAEMLPEITQLAARTQTWNAQCRNIGFVAKQVDAESGRTTCSHYEFVLTPQ